MNFYVLQERLNDNTWFDLYTSDLCNLKKMVIILKRKYIDKIYRIVRIYR